ncbi:hypothetical protein RhiirA4_505232 [Rhizophagus irregularis]|uniref:Uncharacterized protein n=1 Tax=Rhizophagus irregularis TaxID=588596 RepID=A0A2I1HA55_9GLOM|nr:hypothetical protein RhiirA4_505232 [Rhizophagus irregularis]
MGKGNDTIVDDKKDDIIIEGKVDVIVEDDVMVEDVEDVEDNIIVDYTNINLQKERENVVKKSYYKQTYANKYFIEEITPELVRCKCGKEIRLKILQRMGVTARFLNIHFPDVTFLRRQDKNTKSRMDIVRIACNKSCAMNHMQTGNLVLRSGWVFNGSIRGLLRFGNGLFELEL